MDNSLIRSETNRIPLKRIITNPDKYAQYFPEKYFPTFLSLEDPCAYETESQKYETGIGLIKYRFLQFDPEFKLYNDAFYPIATLRDKGYLVKFSVDPPYTDAHFKVEYIANISDLTLSSTMVRYDVSDVREILFIASTNYYELEEKLWKMFGGPAALFKRLFQ